MALRLWRGYGIVNVKVEAIDGMGAVISTLAASTVLYLPIKVYSQNPTTGRIDGQPYGYYSQFFNDYNFLGNYIVPYYQSSESLWMDINVSFRNMSHYCPLTRSLYPLPDGARIKVTDIGSGNYYICELGGGIARFYYANGTLIGSYSAINGVVPFAPGTTNIFTGNFCITAYEQTGATCTVTGIAFVGCRGISNNEAYVYGMWSNDPNNNAVKTWINNVAEFIPPDPYSQDPTNPGTEPGGGTGTFDGTGDDIDIPGLPTLSAVDTGFITLFNPSAGQLKSLANYMWSSGFDLDTFKKIFADPMDCILGLSIVPVAVPNAGTGTVRVGNISTGVSMTRAASQYVELDCGTLNVEEYWGAYLDYDPFTKAEIYLPYIGTHPLAVDDIMAKPVHVVYHVDILSGACTAFVKCGGSVLYEFIGQCSSSIPITGNDWTNVINGVITIAGAIGSMVATGGASAPLAAGAIASTAVNSMKSNVEKSGSMSGTGGMLAVQTPYLILTRPRQAVPTDQNQFTGYPSFITSTLGGVSGYTEVEKVHLNGISATEQEIREIETLLKTGVIM